MNIVEFKKLAEKCEQAEQQDEMTIALAFANHHIEMLLRTINTQELQQRRDRRSTDRIRF